MTDQDFDFIRKLLADRSAIVLEQGKQYLVESRLAPLLRRLELATIGDLVARLRCQPANGLDAKVVEAMVTTETSFFRDVRPFKSLRKVVLPELIARRRDERRLSIWCAAASTGQEPYSVAMLLKKHFPELLGGRPGWNVSILATDISGDALARAREGRYNQIEANRGLPAALLLEYFRQHGTTWQLDAGVRGLVEFREMNLARPWPALPPMDLVLLRNVMIYFDVETKKSVLGRVARLLRSDGYLVLGGAETTLNLDSSYRRAEAVEGGFFQLAR